MVLRGLSEANLINTGVTQVVSQQMQNRRLTALPSPISLRQEAGEIPRPSSVNEHGIYQRNISSNVSAFLGAAPSASLSK
jgi:hypothetical protein